MKHKKLKTLFLLGFALTGLQAQEAILASGGDASGDEGSVSYSIGQVVYTTHMGTTGSLAQGVQQSFEISEVSSIEQSRGINHVVSVYPNPTSDKLILRIEGEVKAQFVALLYDMNGKLLVTQKVENNETTIVMDNLVSAIYFLRVSQANKEIKTFKIIKNNQP